MRYLKKYHLFENRVGLIGAINHLKNKYIKIGCSVEISIAYNSIYLTLIKVPEELRGLGIASNFMKELISLADMNKMVITLSPTDTLGSDKSRLYDFYSRYGFEKNK